MSKDNLIRKIATAWCAVPSSGSVPERLKEVATILYAIRNDQLSSAELAQLSGDLLSEDEEVMAVVEHYFYARSQVANAEYSSTNMKMFIIGYQLGKRAGIDMRHNKSNPTTPPSQLQQTWALLGADQGKQDLDAANACRVKGGKATLSAPTFRMPPDFTKSLGGIQLDKLRY